MSDAGSARSAASADPDGLAGRGAVVTGGSRGIGAAVVRRLAAGGARVVTCGRDAAALEGVAASCPPGAVHTVVADVADWARLDAFLAAAAERLGGVDILVNNAGESTLRDVLSTDEVEWERSLRVNLLAAVRASRTVLPGMVARGWGRVVMMSSSGAKYPTAAWIDYAAAKAALAATSTALAREFGRHDVLVNAVLPGLIETPMMQRSRAAVAARGGPAPDQLARQWAEPVPLGRLGRPEEVAEVVRFLCSRQCSYVNGVALDVDGGLAGHVF